VPRRGPLLPLLLPALLAACRAAPEQPTPPPAATPEPTVPAIEFAPVVPAASPAGAGDAPAWYRRQAAPGAPTPTFVGKNGRLRWVDWLGTTRLVNSSPVRSVAAGPDGRWWATGDDDGRVRIWVAAAGTLLRTLEGQSSGPIRALAARADGGRLVSADATGELRVWDPVAGKEARTLGLLEAPAAAVAWGDWIVAAGDDLKVRVFAIDSGELLETRRGPAVKPTAVALSRDGMRLAVGQRNGVVRLWDVRAEREIWAWAGHESRVDALAFIGGDTELASAGPDGIRVWNAADGQPIERRSASGAVTAAAAAPDGRWIVVGRPDGAMTLWTEDGRLDPGGHRGPVRAVVAAPDGSWIATASDDQTVGVFATADGVQLERLTGHRGAVEALAVAPDGGWVASASADGTVRIWHGDTPLALTDPGGPVHAIAVGPEGYWVAAGAEDGAVRLWATDDGRELRTLAGHGQPVTALAIGPGAERLYSGAADGTVRIWDPATGETIGTMAFGPATPVHALAVAPDGKTIACAAGKTIRLVDAGGGKTGPLLEGHAGDVSAVAFDRDGARVFSAGADDTVRVFDGKTGEALDAIPVGSAPLALALARGRVWVGCADATIHVYELGSEGP